MKNQRLFIKFFSCLLALCLTLPSWPQQALALTIGEEKKLGEEFMEQVRRYLPLVQDPMLNEFVEEVGRNVLEAMPPQPLEYNFYVVQDPTFNAFAGPGGHVFINTGLLSGLESETEVAGIVGHEIAHVSCRHISEKISRDQKINLATMAGVLAGVFLGMAPLALGAMAAGQSASLSYSREDEKQADEIGIRYLIDAGYGGAGLAGGLLAIRKMSPYGAGQIPTYLLTHPAVDERLQYLDVWLASRPDLARPTRKLDPYRFNKIRLRTLALYENPDVAESKIQELSKSHPNDPAVLYGLGLIYERNNKRALAVEVLQKATRFRPFDPDVLIALGQAYFGAGNLEQAQAALQSAIRDKDTAPGGHYWLGRVQLEAGQYAEAEKNLKIAYDRRPENLQALYHLANAHGKGGHNAQAHYYLSIFNLDRGDWRNARFHLAKAEELSEGNDELLAKIKEEHKRLPEVRKKAEAREREEAKKKEQEKSPLSSLSGRFDSGLEGELLQSGPSSQASRQAWDMGVHQHTPPGAAYPAAWTPRTGQDGSASSGTR